MPSKCKIIYQINGTIINSDDPINQSESDQLNVASKRARREHTKKMGYARANQQTNNEKESEKKVERMVENRTRNEKEEKKQHGISRDTYGERGDCLSAVSGIWNRVDLIT